MKKRFLDGCIKLIKDNNKDISNEKIDEIRYGLEGVYLTISKTIFIFALTYVLGIFKEMFIMLIIFNILRTTGFGLHAKKVGNVGYHQLYCLSFFLFYQTI